MLNQNQNLSDILNVQNLNK